MNTIIKEFPASCRYTTMMQRLFLGVEDFLRNILHKDTEISLEYLNTILSQV